MAIRKTLSGLIIAASLVGASGAHAGKDTIPNTVSVLSPAAIVAVQASIDAVRAGTATFTPNPDGSILSPAAIVAVQASIDAVRAGTATFTPNPDGSITVTFSNGTTTTFTSGFIGSLIAAYL